MEKEVLIHVKGLHMMDTPEGDEPIEIVVPGEYYFRNGSHYLRYEEMLDEQGDPTVNYIIHRRHRRRHGGAPPRKR